MRNRNNYTPDVLDCLANLSNDEVFTPPKVVNQMLDLLPQEVFQSRETTFLDPFTKSGVFLREITKRLLEYQVSNYKEIALEIEQITVSAIQKAIIDKQLDKDDKNFEDKAREVGDIAIEKHENGSKYIAFKKQLQKALDHILTRQVFGIAITELTAELARRSLYCSKDASGKYSIVNGIFNGKANGNIRFVPMKHKWEKGNCIFCGASRKNLDRPDEYESHAYEFIHRNNVEDIFMGLQFTVVCGNPPYQLNTNGFGAQAIPIYHLFIQKAKMLNPRYLTMIIPARWMTGGMGLNKFREEMLSDKHISCLHDFATSNECFGNGVSITGGVCYFLRDSDYVGECECYRHDNRGIHQTRRFLKENNSDIFIRDNNLLTISRKVVSESTMDSIVHSLGEYKLPSDAIKNYKKYGLSLSDMPLENSSFRVVGLDEKQKRTKKYVIGYSLPDGVIANKYKVFMAKANGAAGTIGEGELKAIIGEPILGMPGDICTFSFLQIGNFDTEDEAKNCISYMKTRFCRALIGIMKQTQNMTARVYKYVPIQDFSKSWTDVELYAKYKLTKEEIKFIEDMVKPME